ncbi:MAG: adenylyl-sulfate kinase [Deltaproteobacteria bacterium]|nr:adenylyl-sulfate kinase [Deltaproteobacteria bacterium]
MKKKVTKNNLTWFNGPVSREDREHNHGHKGAAVWFTGLSASGKSTVAHNLEKLLLKQGCSTYVFDGDNVRHGLCSDIGFSPEDRSENIRRIGEMIKLFVDAGIIAITAFISPYKKDRERIRSLLDDGQFYEIFVDCPVDICEKRDQKGIYAKARTGEIKNFTGISAPYEIPENPDLVIPSHEEDSMDAAERVLELMRQGKIVPFLDGH